MLGDNAGPAKFAAIKKHGLKTLDEDEFLSFIATRKSSKLDEKTRKKIEEEEAIRQTAKEMENREKTQTKKEDKQEGTTGTPW